MNTNVATEARPGIGSELAAMRRKWRGVIHRGPGRNGLTPVLIASSIVGITLLHYQTSTQHLLLHEIYQRLYYIPIVYAAYRYGLPGALAASISSAILYAPHIFMHWEHSHVYMLNQYAEIIMFQAIAVVTGLLATAEKRERLRYERAANELHQTYEELRQAYNQLSRADRLASLGEVSAGIVHEIRTPLTSINGAVEVLQTPGVSESTKSEFLQIIHHEVDRLNRIVGEFLQFARPRPPERSPTDLNQIVRSVMRLCQKQAAKEKVDISARLEEPLPSVLLDSEQIKQVLLNLVINGIQAMPGGGALKLTSRREPSAVVLAVQDSGPGIDEFLLEKIFDPFFTTKSDGTGLGLSIAYRLVKQNAGEIEVINLPGGGCEFKLVFPVAGNE
ncbi:MAG: sensor histidine kinase [Acidobacteria bacterium]|nr:sensor histidine kinase [Acidobacteriota bacterium]